MVEEPVVSATRFNKAVSLLVKDRVIQSSSDLFIVQGSDDHPYIVQVTPELNRCNCPWGQHAPTDWSNPCAHTLAAAGFGRIRMPKFVVPVDFTT